jgi:predicted amidophosphoribosyltransferase
MKCPKCQHENEQGDRFCRECGERLPSVCPQCGNLLKPGDRFCAKCGTRLAESESS